MGTALAPVSKLTSRVNINLSGAGTGLNAKLFLCLESATTQLKNILGVTSFDYTKNVVEEFEIPNDHSLYNTRYISFRLNSNLVSTTPNVVVKQGSTTDDLIAATAIDSKYIKIDHEKGLVHFDWRGVGSDLISISRRTSSGTRYTGQLFQITYTHGLKSETDKEGDLYENVPDWLEELALIKAREIYQLTVPVKEKKAKDQSVNMTSLFDARIRYYPSSIKPIV